MKGIILSGGKGTRLSPITNVISKQLLPVYDKPMIYYPLSTLMLGGIKDIALISTPSDIPAYSNLLGDGSSWGINIDYYEQKEPLGLAQAFTICSDFINEENVCLILGDNIFHGNMRMQDTVSNFSSGAMIFGYSVSDPQRYGVIEFGLDGKIKNIIEKPQRPPSNYAIPGLYIYDKTVVPRTESLSPSSRGELEITDLNKLYLNDNELQVQIIGRGIAWFDAGTADSLQESSSFIRGVEKVQSYKIACPEEIALRQNFIDLKAFDLLLENMPDNEYSSYLHKVRKEFDGSYNFDQNVINELQP